MLLPLAGSGGTAELLVLVLVEVLLLLAGSGGTVELLVLVPVDYYWLEVEGVR